MIALQWKFKVGPLYLCISVLCIGSDHNYIHTVAPEVDVSATSTRIAVGQSTTLTCTISRSNPSDYTVEWSSTNTNDVTTTLAETGETLVVTDIADNEFGTYTCNVTNSADLSGSANITIEEGGEEFSLDRPCFFI